MEVSKRIELLSEQKMKDSGYSPSFIQSPEGKELMRDYETNARFTNNPFS